MEFVFNLKGQEDNSEYGDIYKSKSLIDAIRKSANLKHLSLNLSVDNDDCLGIDDEKFSKLCKKLKNDQLETLELNLGGHSVQLSEVYEKIIQTNFPKLKKLRLNIESGLIYDDPYCGEGGKSDTEEMDNMVNCLINTIKQESLTDIDINFSADSSTSFTEDHIKQINDALQKKQNFTKVKIILCDNHAIYFTNRQYMQKLKNQKQNKQIQTH